MEGVGADKAGLLSGDVVISIDGVNVAEIGYENASALLKGEIGSQVTLGIRRGTETFTVDIVRSQYAAQTVFAETVMRGGNLYGLVQITEFLSVQTTFYQFKTAVDALIEYGVQGLIFDVRNNLGGDVNAVLRMLDYLLPEGPLVHLYYADQIDPITRYSDAGHIDLPMVVLVNEYTASSAELFAAALRDYELGVIVGETTYGKGVAQSTYKLESGGAVRLTTAKYYPPSGQGYDGIGVVPHIEVKSDNVNLFLTPHGEDPVYQAALEELTS
jgi:carboxyl-terminal processing protease